MKTRFIIVIATILVAIGLNATMSCTNGVSDVPKVSDNADAFMSALCQGYYGLETTSLMPSASTRGGMFDANDCVIVKVSFPADATPEEKELVHYVKTIQDLSSLYRITAADLTIDSVESLRDFSQDSSTIVLSKSKAKVALKPYVKFGVNYLKAQGLTEVQIDSIKEVTNATDEDLVLAAMVLLNQELKNHESAIAKLSVNSFSLFATPSYAISRAYLSHAMDCGMQALGADIFAGLAQSTAKRWTKKIILKVFKTVAKKAIGPVGVAIAVGEFTWCMYNKYNGHDCSYSIKVPGPSKKFDRSLLQ